MRTSILTFTSLVLVMLVTGVFWGTWFTLTRSIEAFTPDMFIKIGKTIISNVAWPMRILMPATLLSLLLLCLHTRKAGLKFYCFVTSLIFMLITLLITVIVEVPIDNQIAMWTTETIPDDWTALRSKWSKFHFFRTFTSILSFVTLAAAAVMTQQREI